MSTTTKQPDTRGLAGQTIGDTSILLGRAIAPDLPRVRDCRFGRQRDIRGSRPPAAGRLADGGTSWPHSRPISLPSRSIPESVQDVVAAVASSSEDVHPMSILRTGVLLSHIDPECEDNSPEAELRKSKRLMAKIPAIIGCGQAARDGRLNVEPDPSLSHAANLLWCITGEKLVRSRRRSWMCR